MYGDMRPRQAESASRSGSASRTTNELPSCTPRGAGDVGKVLAEPQPSHQATHEPIELGNDRRAALIRLAADTNTLWQRPPIGP